MERKGRKNVSVLVREIDASAAVDSRITDDLRYSRADALRHAWVGVIIGRCRLAATIAILGSVYCDEEVCAW